MVPKLRTYIILRQLSRVVKKNNNGVRKMKYKIFMIVLFFLFMAAVPLGFVINNPGEGTAIEEKTDGKEIISRAAALCEDSFSDEAVKAAVIIERTNYLAGEKNANKEDYNSNSELNKRIEQIYNSSGEIIKNNGKPVYIPCAVCSSGYTEKSSEYPYIEAVASPWDRFSDKYDSSINCVGVSLSGIKYLCEKGLDAKEALQWYLPGLEIGEEQSD